MSRWSVLRLLLGAIAVGAASACGAGQTAAERTSEPPQPTTVVVTEPAPPTEPVPATTQLAPRPPDFPELIRDVRSGVIRIEVGTCKGGGQGSGFLIGDRLVVTAEHVVSGVTEIVLRRGGKTLGSAEVIGSDSGRDLALLRADSPIKGHRFRLAGRAPKLGQDVAVLGYPLGLPLTVTRRSVSGLNRTIPIGGVDRTRLVQTDAAVNPGNSGGPLLELDSGRVVGVVSIGAAPSEATGIAFAVSARVGKPLLEAWQVAPQPVALAICTTEAPDQPVAESAPPPLPEPAPPGEFVGAYFSILYPGNWAIETTEADKGTYLDTTIRDPNDPEHVFVRVDVSPEVNAVDAESAAAPVVRNLEDNRATSSSTTNSFRSRDMRRCGGSTWSRSGARSSTRSTSSSSTTTGQASGS